MSSAGFSQRAPGQPALPGTAFRFIWYFVKRYRGWYLTMLLFETLNASCGILIPYSLSVIIKSVTTAEASAAVVASLRGPLLLFFGLCAGEVLFGRLTGAIQSRLGPRQRRNVTRTLYEYLQHHSHRYFTDNFAGSLAHRISETSSGVTMTLWALIIEFWPIVVVFSVAVTLLALRADPTLSLFVGLWGAGFIGISFWLARRARPFALRAAGARSDTTGAVVDSVTNFTSARLFARLGYEREHLGRHLAKEFAATRQSVSYTERVRWFQFTAAALLKVGTLYFALTLWGQGRIGVAEFVMAVSLSLLIINEARNLSRRFLEVFEHIGNVANGVQVIVRPHELIDEPGASELQIDGGAIEFRDLCFAYAGGKPVFDRLDVRIEAGQRVGLVGFSGSGKSTFVNLVLRLYDPQAGRILIDGQDIRQVTQDSLHRQISLIPQDPNLFHRSLMENIRYGRPDASDAEVIAASRQAHAHEFISQIRDGYASMVGERGVKLSGGQRQRVAIARVVLKNAPVLILDEATSALDSITEKAIQETLDRAMRGKTVIVVAHRLSTIAHLDRILVFDQGRVVEDGSHSELLASRGAYYRLWSRQADGFLPDGDDTDPAPARHPSPALARETS